MAGIASFGGYIPRLRLSRKAMADANSWADPSLKGYARGERSMCNWDEDSLTMAVAAARKCVAPDARSGIGSIQLASTTLPFSDRQNATVLGGALNMPENLSAADVSGSMRASTTGLINALKSLSAGGDEQVLFVASEKRATRAAGPQEMLYGDGAAALLLSADDGLAKFLGSGSISTDFVDHFRDSTSQYDYHWEDRWIRDEGFLKIVPKAVEALFSKLNISGDDIDHVVMPCIYGPVPKKLAGKIGVSVDAFTDNLQSVMGEAGTAHSLIMLIVALEKAKSGDKILVIGFGQGADALLFEATDKIGERPMEAGVTAGLARRCEETNYNKFLSYNGLLDQDFGKRAEGDRQTALSVLYRKKEMLTGMMGGKCDKCGTVQFPKSRICVNPNCNEFDSQIDHAFADAASKIMSWSADYLTFTLEPPAHYGMIQFDEGGRVLMDFTDVSEGEVEVGDQMELVFRIKELDKARGFKRYFWKAAPAA